MTKAKPKALPAPLTISNVSITMDRVKPETIEAVTAIAQAALINAQALKAAAEALTGGTAPSYGIYIGPRE